MAKKFSQGQMATILALFSLKLKDIVGNNTDYLFSIERETWVEDFELQVYPTDNIQSVVVEMKGKLCSYPRTGSQDSSGNWRAGKTTKIKFKYARTI